MAYLTDVRHALHQHPEISGEEEQTAKRIVQELTNAGADRIWQGLGGYGVAAEFKSDQPGPTLLFRCELDALPITEKSELAYRSACHGKGHLCGHDGHMSIVLGVALGLAQRPSHGRVILLFQPAEETGAGAQAVISDPRWPDIRPDYAFAYHNAPGRPLGEVGISDGTATCASRGMQINFHGKSSHAAKPEDGVSPGSAMADLMQTIPTLSSGSINDDDYGLCTLTYANLGRPTFGVAPGEGELRVTLRSKTDDRMNEMISTIQGLIDEVDPVITTEVHWHDVFPAGTNQVQSTDISRVAVKKRQLTLYDMPNPMSWSEDFGHFSLDGANATMLFLGAGTDQPQLHNPDYDFPDELIGIGAELLLEIIDTTLANDTGK
ncbi:amidohydrolase family protein [Reinekea sp. MED297]|uniref:Amidohydrolase family protein n=1 Tax=Reinekea blandensis MED297 TaxID=314283 RepID=A4BIF0_9GAMM|nr:amidohydrolase family protein [Reinekea sp. MED297] [Reinekea blandensis MED297]